MIYINEFYDSEDKKNADYIQTCMTKHDCQKLIRLSQKVYNEIVDGTEIEDINVNNGTIKEELAFFCGLKNADENYDFVDYYENSFGFVFAVLERANEVVREVEFRSYLY